MRIETAREIGRETGLILPDPLRDALVAPEVCDDLFDYLRRLDLALEVMQRPADLERVARELVEDLAADGVVHAEVRFAPQLHTRRGLSMQEVLDAVARGLGDGGRAYGVTTGLILCCLRHRPAEEGLLVAQLAAANAGMVCALDLSGDEGNFPSAAPHIPAFRAARDAGLRLTAHAGENAGAQSMREVLDLLEVERIGHGVRVEEDAALVDRIAGEHIALDMCPRSNVQTRAVASMDRHPIDRLLRRGVRVTVSTDGRTTSDTSVSAELERLRDQFGWGRAEMLACQHNAARAVFAPPAVRDAVIARIEVEMSAAEPVA